MRTHDTTPDLEHRLRAALAARADLVRPEDLAAPAPVVPLRPRWWSPRLLLATAAVTLLVLGVLVQGLGRDQRSDDVAPEPDERVELQLPADIGRNWEPSTLSRPPRLDLDGDGTQEKVAFLAEPADDFTGRFRMQTTLSTSGEEAYGLAEVGTTIDINVLGAVDADDDGDEELVLYRDDVVDGGYPLVYDLRDGLLVQAAVDRLELLVRGNLPVAGSRTEHYELVRLHDYWLEDGALWSSRSVGTYATGNMTIVRPETVVLDAWRWRLSADGLLEPVDAGCLRHSIVDDSRTPCEDDAADDLPRVSDVAEETIGPGQSATFSQGYRYSARIEGGERPTLVVETEGGRTIRHPLEVADPRISRVQPIGVMSDGASFVVSSSSDPTDVRVLAQDADGLTTLEPVGEIDLRNDDSARTWLTDGGTLVTAVAGDDGTWRLWFWQQVARSEMAALPGAVVCFDDPGDPATLRRC